ncbi:MAG: hypothetical protein ACJ8FA_16075 [Xanthobacteraceae bacterium]
MTVEPLKPDKFTSIYGLWVGALFLFYTLIDYLDRLFHLYLLVIPLVLLPTIILAVSLLAILIWNAFMRRWRRCASVIVGPVVAYAVLSLAADLGINVDRLRFELTKSEYMKRTAQLAREDGEPLFAAFDWGSTGGVPAANIFYHLIFEESDELALSPEQRSEQWKRRVERKMYSVVHPGGNCFIEVKKMEDHFYFVRETCQ